MKTWRASTDTVRVTCPMKDCLVKGVAAANAVSDETPLKFRAACPEHDVALVVVTP